jgi:hypothetical protein
MKGGLVFCNILGPNVAGLSCSAVPSTESLSDTVLHLRRAARNERSRIAHRILGRCTDLSFGGDHVRRIRVHTTCVVVKTGQGPYL